MLSSSPPTLIASAQLRKVLDETAMLSADTETPAARISIFSKTFPVTLARPDTTSTPDISPGLNALTSLNVLPFIAIVCEVDADCHTSIHAKSALPVDWLMISRNMLFAIATFTQSSIATARESTAMPALYVISCMMFPVTVTPVHVSNRKAAAPRGVMVLLVTLTSVQLTADRPYTFSI